MVITHHNYHTHLHCGVARMEIPPPCLSEQRAEALSEDQYLAGNLNVLNFFHMSLQDSSVLLRGDMTDSVRQWGSSKGESFSSVTLPASHVKDSSRRLARY